jgi:hypothetical protein
MIGNYRLGLASCSPSVRFSCYLYTVVACTAKRSTLFSTEKSQFYFLGNKKKPELHKKHHWLKSAVEIKKKETLFHGKTGPLCVLGQKWVYKNDKKGHFCKSGRVQRPLKAAKQNSFY